MIINIIAAIILCIGVVCIFDARRIARKIFTMKNRNETTLLLKNVGVILVIISILIFLYLR